MKRSISENSLLEDRAVTIANNLDTLPDLSIIITTFEDRFFEYTLPLISKIRTVTNVPIFLIINGNFKGGINGNKLQLFIKELGYFTSVYPTTLFKLHGCAELWNIGITNSEAEYFLILNDDIIVFPKIFNIVVANLSSILDDYQLTTMNRSFSHFGISRKCISDIGFFDEHFLGIGEEDRDYFYRFEEIYGRKPFNINTEAFLHFGDKSKDEDLKSTNGSKYSAFNLKIKEELYAVDPHGSIFGRYEYPMRRLKKVIDSRPLWKFRTENYKKLSE